ncbi:MAG: hypothetical protein D6814_02665 [Calditrichaeota bacterium]|nr:MAG: hypothetical protein D6814_02665 [Calditrichota bacterium]
MKPLNEALRQFDFCRSLKMKYYIRRLPAALLLLPLLGASAFAGELVEKFDKTFTLEPGQHFYLRNKNGAVRIFGWDKKEVRVEAIKRVRAGSRNQAEEIMREIKIDVTENKEGLSIETYIPRSGSRSFLSWLFDGFSSHSIEVKYTLWMPPDLISEIRTINGSISAKDLQGEVSLKSTNGRISVENASGLVQARTTNGSVSIELIKVQPDAELRVRTTNGSIKLYLPEDFSGELTARTTNGSITTEFPVEVSGQFSRRRLHGWIGNGTAKCDLATTNGSIKILKIED